MIITIVTIVEKNSVFTLSQINNELRIRMPNKPRVCDNTISTVLSGQMITLKMSRDVPAQRNTPDTKRERHVMADWLLRTAAIEKIYIHESGFRLWSKRTYTDEHLEDNATSYQTSECAK